MEYKLKFEKTVTQEDLDNIIDSAVAWCAYWCDLLEIGKRPMEDIKAMSEVVTRGGTLVFHIDEPFEDGGKKRFVLTAPKMVKALKKYGEFDFEDFDGPMSDSVLQIALFGEVVYG